LTHTDWYHYYGIDKDGFKTKPGAIYEPLVNRDRTELCMNFNNNQYRDYSVDEDLISDCFNREVKYLTLFQKYDWCARLKDIDFKDRKIYIEWNDVCCETYINSKGSLDAYCPRWTEQLEQITKDLIVESVYKVTMYPCYHFIDKNGVLKAFAFYTASDYSEQPISIDMYRPILNQERSDFINIIEKDGKVDLKEVNKHSFINYIKWPGDPLPGIYKRLYGVVE
jgi:hypothetical protein